MEINKLDISKLQPNPFNPNKMPEGTFKKLCLSIKKFGLFNPLLVRTKKDHYEIIDGEWRWRAYKKLNLLEIPCRIIKATDEEVKQMIFATKITGKHNAFESQEVLKGFMNTTTSEDMQACNLDKSRLERKTKYMDFKKGDIIQKGNKKLKDEKVGLPSVDEYTCLLLIPLPNKIYNDVVCRLTKIDKNLTTAFLKLLGE